MIRIENEKVVGIQQAIEGMRNSYNSWDKCDSYRTHLENAETGNTADFEFFIGDEDLNLMEKLSKAGSSHRKFMRMIMCYADITAPLYWWKQFDTYRAGVEKNSCSTMHTICAKRFEIEDFSTDGIEEEALTFLYGIIDFLNKEREYYLASKENQKSMYNKCFAIPERYWNNIIKILPSCYNQKRKVMLSYEAIKSMVAQRHDHKLKEWHDFCGWAKTLPYYKEFLKY